MLKFKKIKNDNKGCKLISNKNLEELLKTEGREFTLTLYVNRRFALTKKQLDYILNYKKRGECK